MSSYDYHTPDLASILRTLSGQGGRQNIQQTSTLPVQETQYGHYPLPLAANASGNYYTQQAQTPYMQQSLPYPSLPISQSYSPVPKAVPEPPQKTKPDVDPKTITTWPFALRYVTKLTQDDEITDRIKKLIKSQHDHEKQWAEGREKLIQDRQKREQGRNSINDILRAVGGLVDTAPTGTDTEDEATALATYDKKVHKACTEMVRSVTSELAALGIPFFVINRSLVEEGHDDPGHNSASVSAKPPEQTISLTSKALKVLQTRMLELLEDLCRD